MQKAALIGTEEEKEKYGYYLDVVRNYSKIEFYEKYLTTFDNLYLIPLAAINISSVSDNDIDVNITVNEEDAEIIIPTKELINAEFKGVEGLVYELGIIEKLLKLPEDSNIKSNYDRFKNIPKIRYKFKPYTPFGVNNDDKYDSEDYENEILNYIAKPVNGGKTEFLYRIKSLRAKETVWIGDCILFRPKSKNIRLQYSIKSNKSNGENSGTLNLII